MPVKQQFILDVDAGDIQVISPEVIEPQDGTGTVSLLLKSREAAEALYADLGEALGHAGRDAGTRFPGPHVPTQSVLERRAILAAENTDLEPEVWTDEMIAASLAMDEEQEIKQDVIDDPIAAAAAAQVTDRRALQAADPANAGGNFSPHVAATVPPWEPRGSSIGARHTGASPEQAF